MQAYYIYILQPHNSLNVIIIKIIRVKFHTVRSETYTSRIYYLMKNSTKHIYMYVIFNGVFAIVTTGVVEAEIRTTIL